MPAPTADESVTQDMTFTEEEAAMMRACCYVTRLSPRSIKRLVNVMKLLKLVWARSDRGELTRDNFATMTLLVSLTGAHAEVMRSVLRYLDEQEQQKCPSVLIDLLEEYKLPADEASLHLSHEHWLADIKTFRNAEPIPGNTFRFGTSPLTDMEGILNLVGGFCFVGDVGSDPDLAAYQRSLLDA